MPDNKSRVRLNILDIIIMILFISLITGFVFRNRIIEMFDTENYVDINYTFEVKELDSTRFSYLSRNVVLKDVKSGIEIGKIASVSGNTAIIDEYTINGNIIKTERIGYYDTYVEATAKGIKSDTGIFIDGEFLIAPGMSLMISTDTSVYKATILSIE